MLLNLPTVQRLRTLRRCQSLFRDTPSLLRALRVRGSGRQGGESSLAAAVPMNIRSSPFPVYVRPGTDDLAVLLEIFLNGEYAKAVQLLNRPVRTIVDLGSNIGCSIAFLTSVFPQARVIGVEPSVDNLAVARRTLAALIQAERVTFTQAFVGGQARFATIGRSGAGGSNELCLQEAQPGADQALIPVITMPEIIARYGLDTIDLLKCDIEGSEHELFMNCREWIHNVNAVVVELHSGLDGRWLQERLSVSGAWNLLEVNAKTSGTSVVWCARSFR